MKARAILAAAGARTAIGHSATETGFLLRTGVPALVDGEGEQVTMGFDPTLDPYLVGEERAAALAAPALAEALGALGDAAALTLGLFLCVDAPAGPRVRGVPAPGARLGALVHAYARTLAPGISIEVAARGAAGAALALPGALEALAARKLDAVVIGGVHTDYDPEIIAALDAAGRLFSPRNLDARVPGEAAAFVVLTREEMARRLGLRPMARVLGVGSGVTQAGASAFDAGGLAAAIRGAGEEMAEAQARVGWALVDHGAEVRRLHEWQAAVTRTRTLWGEPHQVDAPAQRLGHLGAAALPLAMALAGEGFRRGWAPASVAMALAGSDGGERGAVLLGSA